MNPPMEIFAANVSHGARLLCALLWALDEDGRAWVGPRVTDLSASLSQGRATTRHHIRELEALGAIRADVAVVWGRALPGWSLAIFTSTGWQFPSDETADGAQFVMQRGG